MSVLKKYCVDWVIVLACLGTVGCAKEHRHSCGIGDEIEFEGARFCVYKSSIIEEGFRCPSSAPNEYDYGEYKACGAPAEPPENLEQEVYRLFVQMDAAVPDTANPNSCDYDGQRYQTDDIFCATDGCNECACNPEPGVGVGCTLIGCEGEPVTNNACADQMWHLTPVDVDPISIRLNGDGTFRWVMDGCDFGAQSTGVYRRKWDGRLRFGPAPGETIFSWVNADTDRIEQITSLEAQINGETGNIEVEFENTTQVWESGGLCPVCGELGPSATEACDDFRGG